MPTPKKGLARNICQPAYHCERRSRTAQLSGVAAASEIVPTSNAVVTTLAARPARSAGTRGHRPAPSTTANTPKVITAWPRPGGGRKERGDAHRHGDDAGCPPQEARQRAKQVQGQCQRQGEAQVAAEGIRLLERAVGAHEHVADHE